MSKRDSVLFVVGYGLNFIVFFGLTMIGGALTWGTPSMIRHAVLGVGASVTFCSSSLGNANGSAHPIDVIFDHPELVDTSSVIFEGSVLGPPNGSGNIVPFLDTIPDLSHSLDSVGGAARSFPVPGIYHAYSHLYPITDTVEIEIRQDSVFKQY